MNVIPEDGVPKKNHQENFKFGGRRHYSQGDENLESDRNWGTGHALVKS